MKQGIHPTYYPDAKVILRLLRHHLDNRFDQEGNPRRNLLELPPVLLRRERPHDRH